MSAPLHGKNALITGASRGIGAATALMMAQRGCNIILNYRSKEARALEIARGIESAGVTALLVKADMTVHDEVSHLISQARSFGPLDFLILNASGGMENDRPEEYAMLLNRDAQMHLAQLASTLMPPGSRIVFVTSHWAHFYRSKPVMLEYESVAKSKLAGEESLRDYSPDLAARGISLVVVSGDLIEGTVTPKLLQRQAPGLIERRRLQAGELPTVDVFASAIVQAALDPLLPTGHTVYVGSTDY